MTEPSRFGFTAMGSACMLHLHDADLWVAQAAETEVLRIEQRYSRYRPDSLLSHINRVAAEGGSLEVDQETSALIDYAFACHRQSGGLFDITTGILRRAWNFSAGQAPAQPEIDRWLPLVGLDKISWKSPALSFPVAGVELDFGGIGKEYAADRAAAVCQESGVAHGLIELGGDIRAIGPHPDGAPWDISIRDPRTRGQSLAQVALSTGALATSGDYERCITIDGRRYGHILNPHTGWPVLGLASVSVVAGTCLVAGSISTIALLRGVAGVGWLKERGLPCVWVDREGAQGGSLSFLRKPPLPPDNAVGHSEN